MPPGSDRHRHRGGRQADRAARLDLTKGSPMGGFPIDGLPLALRFLMPGCSLQSVCRFRCCRSSCRLSALEPCAASAHYWSMATELGLTPPAQVFRRLLLRRSVSHPGSPTVPAGRWDGTMNQNHRTERTISRLSRDEYATFVNSNMCHGSQKWLAGEMVFR